MLYMLQGIRQQQLLDSKELNSDNGAICRWIGVQLYFYSETVSRAIIHWEETVLLK